LCFLYRFFVKRMLLTSKTIVQIQSKLEAIKACCVILSKETLIASVRVMNHVHSVTFLHRYIVFVDNKFRKTCLLWKRWQSISTETVMQFTEDHDNRRFQTYRFLYCETPQVEKSYPCSLRVHLLHLINFHYIIQPRTCIHS
jgi:hypothetical protein